MSNDENSQLLNGIRSLGLPSNDKLPGLGLGAFLSAPPPPPPSWQLKEVSSLWFNQKDVVLDGWKFISCRFDNCRIFVSSQHFELINCKIDDESVIYYQNDIVKVIKLFKSRGAIPSSFSAHFDPLVNPDGTISIVR
ncbi:hypothetical protein ERD95_27190 [Enterobacteriaceae bacterium ML5]|nr:hypothetical protein ERD95_27190 [Enterobacteriaceae bacterium ML5]